MNAKKLKVLRRMAREEMVNEPRHEFVASANSRTTAVVAPNTLRAMNKALKKALKKADRGQAAAR